jgi:pimeloyl-ACP methyl ester carboxylesterase
MRCDPGLHEPSCSANRFLRRVALLWILSFASLGGCQSAAALTNQVVLFTGLFAGPGPDTGMDFLNTTLAASGIPNYLGQVFEWTERQQAFDWIQQNSSDRSTLVLIGHSFGGSSALQVANDFLRPVGVTVDLTIQLDSVTNFFGGTNNVLPTNVDLGINYYQISTGLFDPQGEDFVMGAANFNAEVVFNDTAITHTSIDDDPRMHFLIAQNIRDNLNPVTADYDLDGDVDGRDFLAWQRGGSPSPLSASDLGLWQTQYGNAPLNALAVAVPEPPALVLFCLTILAMPGMRFLPRVA